VNNNNNKNIFENNDRKISKCNTIKNEHNIIQNSNSLNLNNKNITRTNINDNLTIQTNINENITKNENENENENNIIIQSENQDIISNEIIPKDI
jgi:hypothetical protein